jgi:protein-S-isoprenylcysteine O-methyltransferase Ste14
MFLFVLLSNTFTFRFLDVFAWILFILLVFIDGSLIFERFVSIKGEIIIWPPPSDKSWQKKYINYVLGFAQIATPIVSILDRIMDYEYYQIGYKPVTPFRITAIVLLAIAGPLGIWGAMKLSWYQSLGGTNTLRTEGPYKFTRNPQYVSVIIVYPAVAVLCNSWRGLIIGIGIALWFLLAPRTEEPWLHAQFGKAYEDYCAKTPRFFISKNFVSKEQKKNIQYESK